MRSSTSSAPLRAIWTPTSAWTSVYDLADAAPVRASPARSAATRTSPLRARSVRCRLGRGRRGPREADSGRLALARVLDLEELALREPERPGKEHCREGLDPVVERQHRVVVD